MEGKKFLTGLVVLIFCGSGAGAGGAGGRTMDWADGTAGRKSPVTLEGVGGCWALRCGAGGAGVEYVGAFAGAAIVGIPDGTAVFVLACPLQLLAAEPMFMTGPSYTTWYPVDPQLGPQTPHPVQLHGVEQQSTVQQSMEQQSILQQSAGMLQQASGFPQVVQPMALATSGIIMKVSKKRMGESFRVRVSHDPCA